MDPHMSLYKHKKPISHEEWVCQKKVTLLCHDITEQVKIYLNQ